MSTTASKPPLRSSAAPGFASLDEEISIGALPVRGEIPRWLAGALLRAGPAKWDYREQSVRHWFDGAAMLHRFTFNGGRVSYANRFLDSRAYRAAQDQGKIAYREFATDPCRSLFKRVASLFSPESKFSDNCNVNLTRLGERFVAMTETPIPVQFDPTTLATAGVAYQPPGALTTAHPHLERSTGGMLNYAAKLGPRSEYRFFHLAPDSREPEVIASLPVGEPSYMHSFGLTERWLVLAEFPFTVNPLRLVLSGRPYIENYRWHPERGTRFTLLERSTGEVIGPFGTEARFAFHHANAYDDGDRVVVDICTYPDAGIVEDLYLDRLRSGAAVARPTLERFTLWPGTDQVEIEGLSEEPLELPRINYGRSNERRHRYVWGVSIADSDWFDRIVKVDVETRSAAIWAEQGCYPGEPVFVPSPQAQAEDDGVLLSVVFDGRARTSFLLVLDAATLAEVARADVPHHIPFAIHGQFTQEQDNAGTQTY
jgi:carotenoid cleavage dioxygenase-like enzyme